MPLENEFHGPNLGYILELYEQYRDDPSSVDESTRKLFGQWSPADATSARLTGQNLLSLTGAANLAQAIRVYGYLSANLDPLDAAPDSASNPLLTPGGTCPEDGAAWRDAKGQAGGHPQALERVK